MRLINIKEINNIKAFIGKHREQFQYKNKISFFGLELREEGFYIYGHHCKLEDISEKYEYLYAEGNNVFYKPYLIITMNNKCSYDKFFESEELKTINWIYL